MNNKLGFYQVDQTTFSDKLDAVLYAGLTRSSISWHFNDQVYDNLNWKQEPSLGLDDYYKLRAQQIRDQYDYVIILCSGGGDSTNVVWSFLRNNIHVDEVIAAAPLEGLKNYVVNDSDTSAGNTMSETMLAQLPLMEQIHSQYPDVKITINDYFQNLLEYKTDDWLFRSGEWIHPTSSARYELDKLTHIKDLAEQGKKIGIVYGIDKPLLYYDEDNVIGIFIGDLAVNVQRPPFKDRYPNVDNVLFYFAPDLPDMQVKQAHVLAKWIHQPENNFAQSKILDFRKSGLTMEAHRIRNSFYERAIIPCIYPSTHRRVFQGHKPTRIFLGEHDDWFYKRFYNTRTFEMIASDFRNFFNELDPMYLNEAKMGIKNFFKLYPIGKIDDFKPKTIELV